MIKTSVRHLSRSSCLSSLATVAECWKGYITLDLGHNFVKMWRNPSEHRHFGRLPIANLAISLHSSNSCTTTDMCFAQVHRSRTHTKASSMRVPNAEQQPLHLYDRQHCLAEFNERQCLRKGEDEMDSGKLSIHAFPALSQAAPYSSALLRLCSPTFFALCVAMYCRLVP